MTGRAHDWQRRFDALAARKTRRASAAHLFPFVTDAVSPEPGMDAIGSMWSRHLFDGPFYMSPSAEPRRPACSLVFVQSADGNTGADDPASLGGGATDSHLIYEGLSRVAADAVLAGANTVRDTDVVFSVWHPEMIALRASLGLPRHPIQIVITNRGLAFDDAVMFNVPDLRVILLAGPSVPQHMTEALRARPWITRLPVEGPHGVDAAFERLRSVGITRVSCVGGRTLARELLACRLVDDVYLTTSPHPGGEPDTPLSPAPWRGRIVLRKAGTGAEAGVVFEHIVPRRDFAGGARLP